jgi:hypothetical protein
MMLEINFKDPPSENYLDRKVRYSPNKEIP